VSWRIWLVIGWVACASGCAFTVGTHPTSIDTVMMLRQAALAPLSVGPFKLADGLDKAIDRSITARSRVLRPHSGKSFALDLRDSLVADLTRIGKYAADSPVTITGELTENQLSTGLPQGKATLSARFKVVREGTVLYDRTLTAHEEWPSSFLGVVAINDATTHYSAVYGLLLNQLYVDADFRKAVGESGPTQGDRIISTNPLTMAPSAQPRATGLPLTSKIGRS
jgi:hypothetical protein